MMENQVAPREVGDRGNQHLYPIAVLIDELRSEDQKKRINAVNNIGTISVALGPERSRNELLPYILELLEDDEEVLVALSETIGNMLDHVGGPAYAEHLLRVLERLAGIEELPVREKATESMKQILASVRIKDFESYIMGMMQRMTHSDTQVSKYTVIHLIPSVYTYFVPQNQQELMELFSKISQDNIPQIRKQASIVLNKMIQLIPKVSETELLNIFSKFYKDDQDSVRMQGIDSCVAFANQIAPAKVNSYLLPYIKRFAEDKSWRIRYMVADRIMDLATGFGFEQAKQSLLPFFCAFLKDVESEVRTAALSRMSDFCRILDVPSILTKIVPCFADLQKDTFVYVRCALAENILSLCPALGKANTNQHILPLFLVLLRDESSEVRLNLFKHLEDLNQVIGITELQQSIVPSLEELSKEKSWRMKTSVIQQFPMLARQLGEPFFSEKLSHICFEWMKDPIYTIRETSLTNFKQLTVIFGEQWAIKQIFPRLFKNQTDESYLHRLTTLFGMTVLGDQISADTFKKHFLPVLALMQKDVVPNVRMNVAKTIMSLGVQLKQNKENLDASSKILRLMTSDSDPDVAFFANKALKQLNS